ncbi:MAG TPA: tetratricopeptide repeat protein [Pyrinomonadaceae bacterium]
MAELLRSEDKDRALELLNRAISFSPDEPSGYVARGGLYFYSKADATEAESDFRKALILTNWENASAWAGLGDSLARQGRRDEAISAYKHYLRLRPQSAAHYDSEIRKSISLLKGVASTP